MITLTTPITGYAYIYDHDIYAPVTALGLVHVPDAESEWQFLCTVTGAAGTFAGLAAEIDSEQEARRLVTDPHTRFDLARAALA